MMAEIKNPVWRLNNLYKIVSKAGQKVTFKQNSVQRTLNNYNQKRRRILKARQMGISTNELLKMLDFVLFNRNKTALILAHENDAIEKLFRIVRRAYDFMPEQLKPELDRGQGSKYEMHFPSINSRIYCDLESRGDSIQYLHISEKAFIKDINRVYATIEAVPMDGIITEETTANGLNHFYDSWMAPESNYTNIFLPWYLSEDYRIDNHELSGKDLTDDERELIAYVKKNYSLELSLAQIAFRRFKQRELKGLYKQEYAETPVSCFLTSGQNPFNLEIIKDIYDKAKDPIEIKNGIRIFKRREPSRLYVVGADPAEGIGGDSSSAHVFDVKTREQVASFDGQLKPSEFADKLIEMSELYSGAHPCLIGVERNNHGHAVLLKLDEVHNYLNLFKATEDKLGWITDRVTRPLMVDTFIEGVENGTIKLNDRKTIGECLTLTNNNGKIEALESKHDDLFIAGCIAVQMCIEESVLDVYSDVKSKILI